MIEVTIPHRAFIQDRHPVQIISDYLQNAGVKWTPHSMWMASPEIYSPEEQITNFTISMNHAGHTDWRCWEDGKGRHYQIKEKGDR